MVTIYRLFFAWMPAPYQMVILGLIAYLALILLLRVIKLILDAVPFA